MQQTTIILACFFISLTALRGHSHLTRLMQGSPYDFRKFNEADKK